MDTLWSTAMHQEINPGGGGADPRNFQDYFDQIYDDLVSLRMVPIPISERSAYNRVVQGGDWEGLVCLEPANWSYVGY
jgi:hypothetical protein